MQGENQSGPSGLQEQPSGSTHSPRGEQTYPAAFPDYPSGASQPLYGQPSSNSQPMGYPGGPAVATATPPQPKRSLRWLWITLAVVGSVILLGGGSGLFALSLYGAPGAAATQFCGYLKAQNYDSAYGMFSAKLKGQYTSNQFRAASTQLDTAEGRATACAQASGSGSYDFSLGSSKATVVTVVTREKQGTLLDGGVHLVNEAGGWKVDALDTSLLGVNLGALGTLDAFCTNLKGQNFIAAYGLLGNTLQSALKQDDFIAQSQIHDHIDGVVTNCALDAVTSDLNTDTATALRVTVTRSKLGAAAGTVGLSVESGGWKIIQISATVQGSDLEPLLTGMRFCNFVVAGAWQEAYALLSSSVQQKVTLDDFRSSNYFGPLSGTKYVSCTPDLDTYKASADGGPYDSILKVQELSSGSTFALFVTLFVRPFPEGWRINGWRVA